MIESSSADRSRSCVDGPPARPVTCRRTASQARDVAPGPRMTRSPATQGRVRCRQMSSRTHRPAPDPLIGPDTGPLSPNQLPKPASLCGGWLVSFWAFPQGRDLKSAAEECSCQFGDRLARASQREAIVRRSQLKASRLVSMWSVAVARASLSSGRSCPARERRRASS